VPATGFCRRRDVLAERQNEQHHVMTMAV